MHGDYSKVRLEPESIGTIVRVTETDSSLCALPVASLTKKIFEMAGYQTELSSGGIIARQLVSHLEGIQGARVLKLPGVRRLINTYGPTESFTRKVAVQLICQRDPSNPEASFKDYEDLFIETRPMDEKLRPQAVFAFLVEKGLFRQGVRVRCPACTLPSWVSIDSLTQKLTCDLCGHSYDATRQLVDCEWQYRRSGILGVERNVMGSVPVVLTLQQLDTNIGTMRSNRRSILSSLYLDPIPKGPPLFLANANMATPSTREILRISSGSQVLSRLNTLKFSCLHQNCSRSVLKKSSY
jgi:hypothetical protein